MGAVEIKGVEVWDFLFFSTMVTDFRLLDQDYEASGGLVLFYN